MTAPKDVTRVSGLLRRLACRLNGHYWHSWTGAVWADQYGVVHDEMAKARAHGVTASLPATVCDRCGQIWSVRPDGADQ